MSWQATAWAIKQKTGSPSRKLLLLVLANYADDRGLCWPSQHTLAEDAEQSVDTIQRNLRKLESMKLIAAEQRPRAGGHWPSKVYRLPIPQIIPAEPQNAARSKSNTVDNQRYLRHGHAALSPPPNRIAMRYEPTIEQSIEPPVQSSASSLGARAAGIQGNRTEAIQHQLAIRLGNGDAQTGWTMLQALTGVEMSTLTKHQRQGTLTDDALASVRGNLKLNRPCSIEG